ncbi:hypothetical protein DB345_00315 [Spartobacteria bacterium LR76]|nr:hypothetical protein DB345_00315 [Spartobacteria bacterium LR76]
MKQYACFSCRKCFKRPQAQESNNRFMTSAQQRAQRKKIENAEAAREYKCPDCGTPTVFTGIDFKPPRRSDLEGWKKARRFIESGKIFYRRTPVDF